MKKVMDKHKIFFGIFILIYSILPFLWISFYCHPFADDFCGVQSFKDNGLFESMKIYYFEWSGRFSNSIIAMFSPMIYNNLIMYKIAPCIILLLLYSAIYYLIFNIFKTTVSYSKQIVFLLSSVLISVFLLNLPSPQQGIYWYPGTVVYTIPFILFILFISLLIKNKDKFKHTNFFLAVLLLIIIIGSNEVYIVLLNYVLGVILLHYFIKNKKIRKSILALLILGILFSLLSILAPGNYARAEMSEYNNINQGVLFTLTASAKALISNSLEWFGNLSLLLWLLLYIPVAIRILKQNTKANNIFFINPFFSLLFSILLLFLLFFPFYFAVGNSNPLPTRYLNVIYFVFVLLLFYNTTIVINYIVNIRQRIINEYPRYVTVFIVICLLFPYKDYNIRRAYNEIISGEAATYNKELNSRYLFIKETKEDTVYVKPLTVYPQTICGGDIEKVIYWTNNCYAEYFNKKCILVKE